MEQNSIATEIAASIVVTAAALLLVKYADKALIKGVKKIAQNTPSFSKKVKPA